MHTSAVHARAESRTGRRLRRWRRRTKWERHGQAAVDETERAVIEEGTGQALIGLTATAFAFIRHELRRKSTWLKAYHLGFHLHAEFSWKETFLPHFVGRASWPKIIYTLHGAKWSHYIVICDCHPMTSPGPLPPHLSSVILIKPDPTDLDRNKQGGE